jgi:nucleoid-associated protein YgaU
MSDDMEKEGKTKPKSKPAGRKAKRLEELMEHGDLEDLKAGVSPETAAAKETASEFLAEHTVVSGDTLSGIAQKYYGSQANWKAIYEANKDVIGDNPNLIRIGQVFKIPKQD